MYNFCPNYIFLSIKLHSFINIFQNLCYNSCSLFFFQSFLFEELISPLITPMILLFHLKPKALDIVDFFRNFTVEVVGVGDVCSFAQMDVRRHGNPSWQSPSPSEPLVNQYTQVSKIIFRKLKNLDMISKILLFIY